MKNIYTFFLVPILLTSCFGVNRRINKMHEGDYDGVIKDPLTRETIPSTSTFVLTVTKVSSEEFVNASGLNVVEDALESGKYYLLQFVETLENGDVEHLNFYNLHDEHPEDYTDPVGYCDDNGNIMSPTGEYSYMCIFESIDYSFVLRTEEL